MSAMLHSRNESISNESANNGPTYKLGLIGNGISRSSAPRLHQLAGRLQGKRVTYDLIDLAEADPAGFEGTLACCAEQGYWGVNVTYPFKERAAKAVEIVSPIVQQLGAVNTVVFGNDRHALGHNTDYSGFLRAYQRGFPGQPPGKVALVGTGGVGRPVAFGLAALGAQELRLYDLEQSKAETLAVALRKTKPQLAVHVCAKLGEATTGADGLVNCTPLGMWQHPGNPIPANYIQGQSWAFDVIYTPLKTEFLRAAQAGGLALLSGYELFFYQGVDAYEHFTGGAVDEEQLRMALRS